MIEGHCECKSIGFRVDGEISDFSHCHCSQCRRLHGAAFATFAGVEAEDFHYITDTSTLKVYHSSDNHERYFCGDCGSNIMVKLLEYPDMFYLAMGVVNGDPPLPEAYHIFTGSKAPWHEIRDPGEQFDTEAPE